MKGPAWMSVTIREARDTPEDLDAMVAITRALHAHHAACDNRGRHARDEKTMRQDMRETLEDPDARTWLAVDDDAGVVGMAIGRIREREGHVPNVGGYITKVFVAESHRGTGLARRLVGELVGFFAERGIEQVDLHYLVRNESAQRFWTKLGFEPFLMNVRTTLDDLRARLSG
jgi:ribosomal protein S18 acetylase RimI-like enzyme